MKKTLSSMFGLLLVLFGWISAYPQSNTTKKDYKVVSSEYDTKSENKVLLTEYDFKGSTIKTREEYFHDRETQDKGLDAATKNFRGCSPQMDIFGRTGRMGRKIVCEDISAKAYIIAYSHFDVLNKVNVISGESRRIVENFVYGICPYAYHLYPEIECLGFD